MKIFAICLAVLLMGATAFSLAGRKLQKSADRITYTVPSEAFDRIVVSSPITVVVSPEVSEVTVETHEEYKPYVEASVKSNLLTLKTKQGMSSRLAGRKHNDAAIKVYVPANEYTAVTLSGASSLYLPEGYSAGDLQVKLSGAADMCGSIHCRSLSVTLSGASDMKLSGTCETLTLKVSGASDFRASALRVNHADCVVSGASSAYVYADGRIDVDASGASSFRYAGTPTFGRMEISGASSVKYKKP